MKQIKWREDFSVGVAKLDEQHKWIVQMINKLIEEPNANTKSETISEILDVMTNYGIEHFKTEEDLMRQHNYPQLEEHVAEHLAFREKTANLCFATMIDVAIVPEIILSFLRDWLEEHILNHDMAYVSFFNDQGINEMAKSDDSDI